MVTDYISGEECGPQFKGRNSYGILNNENRWHSVIRTEELDVSGYGEIVPEVMKVNEEQRLG